MTRSKLNLSQGPIAAVLFVSAAVLMAMNASADIVHDQDVIITGSACIGVACLVDENFGTDTIRLKENNLRIKADDTSNPEGSFSSQDWQLTFNDGAQSKFSIEATFPVDRTPFTIEAEASSHSLYIDDAGRIGLGTSIPAEDVHVVTADTPTLRLEQDGSGGFTAQTWDVAGNEVNFFVRDTTNGSSFPLRIEDGAPSNMIYIDGDDDRVGIHTGAPQNKLHVRDGNFRVEQSGTDVAAKLLFQTAVSEWEIKQNGATGRLTFSNNNDPTSGAPLKFDPQAVNNLLRVGVASPSTVDIAGDLVINGDCTGCADYVFEDDYELRPLDEVEAFIHENGHLPNIPSADQMRKDGYSVGRMSGRLLEKVEELTLYTVQQQKLIHSLNGLIDNLNGRLAALEESSQ